MFCGPWAVFEMKRRSYTWGGYRKGSDKITSAFWKGYPGHLSDKQSGGGPGGSGRASEESRPEVVLAWAWRCCRERRSSLKVTVGGNEKVNGGGKGISGISVSRIRY